MPRPAVSQIPRPDINFNVEFKTHQFKWLPKCSTFVPFFNAVKMPVRSFHQSIPDKDLFMLGGYDEVKEVLSDLVRYLQNPADYIKNRVKAPKGVILSGPPGVGKTFFAEALAGHAQVPLIAISAPEVENKYVGETEKIIRSLFEDADKAAPCVLLIDEFDSIAIKRSSSGETSNAKYTNSVVNQLLSILSKDHPGVVVMATTNHYEALDPAIVRQGRFDKHLFIDLPSIEDRKAILLKHLEEKKLNSGISIGDLAVISEGFSGAKIAGWVNEAALLASKQNRNIIRAEDFDHARLVIQFGYLRNVFKTPQQKFHIASHEAGHSVAIHALKSGRVFKISIKTYGDSGGCTERIVSEELQVITKQRLLDDICINMAGRAAEILIGQPSVGCFDDLDNAKRIAAQMIQKEALGQTMLGTAIEVETILKEQLERAVELLKTHQTVWEKLRDALIKHDELFEKDFLNIMSGKSISRKTKIESQNSAKFQIPPKIVKKKQEISNNQTLTINQVENALPIGQVAKAFNISPSKLRSIIKDGNLYKVEFNKNASILEIIDVCRKLAAYKITSYTSNHLLVVIGDYNDDFVEFVKRSQI